MKKLVSIVLVSVLMLGIGVSGFLRRPIADNSNKTQVTASFYPLFFFAQEIGGEKVNVVNITPAGAEPHDYEPTPQDIFQIQKSKLLILNGGVEAWGDKIKDNLKSTNVLIVTAGEGLLTNNLVENGEKSIDPHVWLSPSLAKKEAQKILAGFMQIDSGNVEYYTMNEKKLESKLDALDSEYKLGLKNCQNKDIITSHAAFYYLASAYGLKQVPITGLSPDSEPSARQLADIANFAKQNNIGYIFFESLVTPKLSETVANEIGAKTLVLDPLEGIPQDNIDRGADYFSVMRSNLNNLEIALQCKK